MVDLHTHILYDVDDGVKNIDESIEILKNMSKNGVTDVFLTPHYIEYSSYTSNRKNNLSKIKQIETKLKENNINIKIFLGNEIYISENILDLLEKKEISTLGKSNYLLIELPMSGIFNGYMDIFYELIQKDYKVVLAHPERYIYFHDHFDELVEIHNSGVLFQINLESILGKYGKKPQKTVKKILKSKLVDFVGSDIHRNKSDYSFINKSISKFKKYLSDEEIDLILN